jgi:protein SCO1
MTGRLLTLAAVLLIPVAGMGGSAIVLDPEPVAAAEPAQEERLTEERRRMREDFAGIGVDEHLGDAIDLSIPFLDHAGNPVTLADFVEGDRPVVLSFVYHSCPMLCSIVLDGLTTTLRETRLTLGNDYRVIAVSIDPRDTPERAAAARDRYLRQLAADAAPEAYAFLTGTQESITSLTEAVGFRYEWVERRQEFAHPATLVFLSPAGVITRYLYGLQFPAVDFRRAVVEAGEGTVGSAMDQLLLYCFMWDGERGGYVLHATNAMKVGGLLTLFALLTTLLIFWRREALANLRRRRRLGDWSDYEDALRTTPGS